jgi:hypothetical protein
MLLKDLLINRLFCQYDQSFSCVIYAFASLDISKLDAGAYKEVRDDTGKQYMKEIKERFGRKRERKINLQQQRPFSKYGGEAKKIIDSNRGKPSV